MMYDRINPEEKVGQLLKNLKMLVQEIAYLNDLLEQPLLRWTVHYGNAILNLPFNISLAVVIAIVCLYGGDQQVCPSPMLCRILLYRIMHHTWYIIYYHIG